MNDYVNGTGVGGTVSLTGSQNKWLLLIGAAIIIYLIAKK
jgi:hypothetical protein